MYIHYSFVPVFNIIFGQGPHVTRAIEVYKNRFITYSMGNFCTYKRFNLSSIKGYAPIVKIEMDKNGNFLNGKIISAKQRDAVYPYLDETQAAFKEIKKLTLADFPENKLRFLDDGSFYLN